MPRIQCEIVSSTDGIGKPDIQSKRMKFEPKSYIMHEINSKQSKDLTIRSEDVNLRENTPKSFLTLASAVISWLWHQGEQKQIQYVGLHETEKLMITSLLFPLSRNWNPFPCLLCVYSLIYIIYEKFVSSPASVRWVVSEITWSYNWKQQGMRTAK